MVKHNRRPSGPISVSTTPSSSFNEQDMYRDETPFDAPSEKTESKTPIEYPILVMILITILACAGFCIYLYMQVDIDAILTLKRLLAILSVVLGINAIAMLLTIRVCNK